MSDVIAWNTLRKHTTICQKLIQSRNTSSDFNGNDITFYFVAFSNKQFFVCASNELYTQISVQEKSNIYFYCVWSFVNSFPSETVVYHIHFGVQSILSSFIALFPTPIVCGIKLRVHCYVICLYLIYNRSSHGIHIRTNTK